MNPIKAHIVPAPTPKKTRITKTSPPTITKNSLGIPVFSCVMVVVAVPDWQQTGAFVVSQSIGSQQAKSTNPQRSCSKSTGTGLFEATLKLCLIDVHSECLGCSDEQQKGWSSYLNILKSRYLIQLGPEKCKLLLHKCLCVFCHAIAALVTRKDKDKMIDDGYVWMLNSFGSVVCFVYSRTGPKISTIPRQHHHHHTQQRRDRTELKRRWFYERKKTTEEQ